MACFMPGGFANRVTAVLAVVLVCTIGVSGQNVTKRRHIFDSNFELGGFWPALSTEIRLDATGGESGTSVDFESDLDYDDRKVLPFLQAAWRPSERWLFQADYVNLNRSSSTVLETEITWPPGEDGETFPIGVGVASFLDFEAARVSAAYMFRTSQKSELAVSLGIHLTSMSAGIGLAVGSEDTVRTVEEDMELPLIPLPSLGLYWGAILGEKWIVRLRGDFFALSYDDYSGSLISARFDGAYQFSRNLAAGLGVNYYNLEVNASKTRFTGKAQFGYWGPSLFLRYSF